MWNVEEIVKINKRLSKAGAGSGWGWGGVTEATIYQLQAAEATTWPYWPPPDSTAVGGHRESLRYWNS